MTMTRFHRWLHACFLALATAVLFAPGAVAAPFEPPTPGTRIATLTPAPASGGAPAVLSCIGNGTRQRTVDLLVASHGIALQPRIAGGVAGAAAFWRADDGTAEEFTQFCLEHFIADPASRSAAVKNLSAKLEAIWGHYHCVSRTLSEPIELDRGGDPTPIDHLFARWSPYTHFDEDLFAQKIAFFVLLNFPNIPLAEKLRDGPGWTREQWAMARLGDLVQQRVPGEVNRDISKVAVDNDNYINEYNIHTDRLTHRGLPLFKTNEALITHWGLRDEIKAQYAAPDAMPRQQALWHVLMRIADGTVPRQVIGKRNLHWDPEANVLTKEHGETVAVAPEGDDRYAHWLAVFHAQRQADPFSPSAPTVVARTFDLARQIPVEEVERLLLSVIQSPLASDVATLIGKRLGRPLQPFDIWYPGFKGGRDRDEEEISKLTRARYPNVASFQADLPNLYRRLQFTDAQIASLTPYIAIESSRGAGHAMQAMMRTDQAHLRTRIATDGMDYKGFNIAIHELGHCTEQTFSLQGIDQYLLNSVPNSACTECFAFVFQSRDLDLLGIARPDPQATHLRALDTFWNSWEMAGVSLLDLRAWQWLYAHPTATAAEFRAEVLRLARNLWNTHYAPILGGTDAPMLAVYSHMLTNPLYLSDYLIGHLIAFQIETHVEGKQLGAEMERMCRLGCVTPRQWMINAVGSDVSAEPLFAASRAALHALAGTGTGSGSSR